MSEQPSTASSGASGGLAWFLLRRTWRKFWIHQCTDLAATLTYYGVLGVIPSLIAVISLLGLAGQGSAALTIVLEVGERVLPREATDLVRPLLESAGQTRSGWGVVLGIVGALYATSRYVGAFGRALNRVYGVREGRPVWRLESQTIAVTVTIGVLVTVTVALLVVSRPVADAVGKIAGIGSGAVALFNVLKWPAIVVVVMALLAVLYSRTPNICPSPRRWITLGTLLALVVSAAASALFGIYVANFSSYDATYGSLAGVIIFLVWLWVTNLAALAGAVLDCELERLRELRAGQPAERDLQLALRDTRRIEKQDRREEQDLASAHDLRLNAADRG